MKLQIIEKCPGCGTCPTEATEVSGKWIIRCSSCGFTNVNDVPHFDVEAAIKAWNNYIRSLKHGKPLPCPFCGSKDLFFYYEGDRIICSNCRMQFSCSDKRYSILKIFNMRTTDNKKSKIIRKKKNIE